MNERSGKTILVIEDEENIAIALDYLISREGYAQERMASGEGAVDRIRSLRPDLVLLDVMLPGMSGYEICQQVRLDPALSGVRILMMTARGSAIERRKGLAMGADGFISKPFELKELRDEVRRILEGRPATEARGAAAQDDAALGLGAAGGRSAGAGADANAAAPKAEDGRGERPGDGQSDGTGDGATSGSGSGGGARGHG